MSAALSRLRRLFGDELFVRSPHGLQPTPRALDLAEPLGHALGEIQRALVFTRQFDPTTSSASFTLGMSEHPAFRLLPTLVDALRVEAPYVTLAVTNFTHRDDAVTILDNAEADVTIGVPASVTPGVRILSRRVFQERFVCVVRRDHPVVGDALDLDTFLSLTHLLVSPEGDRFGRVDAALAARGLKRRLGLTLPQMYAAPSVLLGSDMIATLMAGVVEASGHGDQLRVLPPPVDLESVDFVMSWHRRNDAHPAQAWLRDLIARRLDLAGPAP